jgi:hypothetical protein
MTFAGTRRFGTAEVDTLILLWSMYLGALLGSSSDTDSELGEEDEEEGARKVLHEGAHGAGDEFAELECWV